MDSKKSPGVMKTVARIIVDYRYIIYVLFIAAAIFGIFSMNKVNVNSDITAFLPDSTETRQGLTVMNEEFITYGTADVMVANVTYETAESLADMILEIPGVYEVDFDNTAAHYVSSSALLSVTFDGTDSSESAITALGEIKDMLSEYDLYITSSVGEDYSSQLADEMVIVVILAAVVCIAVLLFTSRSYFEVVVFFIVFVFAVILNLGTNFLLGEISSITNSIAIIMQLTLAIDYAIIFSHRYQDEVPNFPTEREALIEALSKAIVEISASSLTTISGLVALTLMQFKLGYDMGMVLAKGVLCSLITVFLLMPGIIMLFPKILKKTSHRTLIPNMRPWGRFLMKSKYLFVIIFVVLMPFAIFCSNHVVYAFNEDTIDELIHSDARAATKKISDTFENSQVVALLVPREDFESEKEILGRIENLENVKSTTGLANISVDGEHVLTDEYTPRMFSELVGISAEESTLLYQIYGLENGEFQAIFGDSDDYSVPLVDMFLYLFDMIDSGVVTLDDDSLALINDLREELERGLVQLRGENWNRMVVTAAVPAEGDESTELINEIRAIAEEYYGEGNVLIIGEITSAIDLAESFSGDSVKINLLTILFVFVILLLTFRSVVGAAILVLVIQGSIWINFTFLYLSGMSVSFVTYMIVSAVQMGATIDYAIVIMNRYQLLKPTLPKREAMAEAVHQSFATVFTSGTIMTVAGVLIAYMVSDVYVGHIGLAVGRGAFISAILVLTVLPQAICLLDKVIDKTRFKIKIRLGAPKNE